jgi:hypothetical protein
LSSIAISIGSVNNITTGSRFSLYGLRS